MLALRQATTAQHGAAEASLGFARAGNDYGLVDYARSLEQLARFWFPAEQILTDYLVRDEELASVIDFSVRGWALDNDLEVLGRGFDVEGSSTVIESRSEAIGRLYVLEGSRLGAKQLTAQLASRVDSAEWPRSFFELGASDATQVWARFRRAAATYLDDDEKIAVACTGAQDSFERLTKVSV